MSSIYTDVERSFLYEYFGMERPPSLSEIDLYKEPSDGGIHLLNESNYPGVNLANAVARLALGQLEVLGMGWTNPLGQNMAKANGRATDGERSNGVARKADLYPLYLFGVNWGLAPNQIKTPEYYYLTWFPEFDRYVVTASVMDDDVYGVADFAIGWDSASNKRIDLTHDIISNYWLDVHKPFNSLGWNQVLSSGLIPETLALDWKDEIWSKSQVSADWISSIPEARGSHAY